MRSVEEAAILWVELEIRVATNETNENDEPCVPEKLVRAVQGLAVDGRGDIEGDKHPHESH